MNPYNYQEYKIIKDKVLKHNFYKIFIILFIIGIIILISKFNFKVYEKYIIIKNNNDYNLIVSIEEIDSINNNKYIYINNKKYSYKVKKIEDNYQNINGTIIKNITISIKDYKTLNDYTYCYFLKNSDTFFSMIIKFIKGGFYG